MSTSAAQRKSVDFRIRRSDKSLYMGKTYACLPAIDDVILSAAIYQWPCEQFCNKSIGCDVKNKFRAVLYPAEYTL